MNRRLKLICLVLILTSCQKQASFKNFSPSKFDFTIAKPFVIAKDSKLFYSTGPYKELDDSPILKLKDKTRPYTPNISVSPNNNWLLINDENKLQLINLLDRTKIIVCDSKSELYFNFEPKKYRWEEMQWSQDSKYILLIMDKEGQENQTTKNDARTTKNEIQIFDINRKEIKVIVETETIIDCYFGMNNESIFYSYIKTPNDLEIKEISIANSEEINNSTSFVDSLLFINFSSTDLQNHSTNSEYVIVDKWSLQKSENLKDGIYIYNTDTLKLLHESILSGENFKGFDWSNHNYQHSYFLPGNRYYAFQNHSKEYNGLLIYDLVENRYQKMGTDVQFYFSLTSNDVARIKDQKPAYLNRLMNRFDLLPVDTERQLVLDK
jgi:hypothetical protein